MSHTAQSTPTERSASSLETEHTVALPDSYYAQLLRELPDADPDTPTASQIANQAV